jgi:hypothetical protein
VWGLLLVITGAIYFAGKSSGSESAVASAIAQAKKKGKYKWNEGGNQPVVNPTPSADPFFDQTEVCWRDKIFDDYTEFTCPALRGQRSYPPQSKNYNSKSKSARMMAQCGIPENTADMYMKAMDDLVVFFKVKKNARKLRKIMKQSLKHGEKAKEEVVRKEFENGYNFLAEINSVRKLGEITGKLETCFFSQCGSCGSARARIKTYHSLLIFALILITLRGKADTGFGARMFSDKDADGEEEATGFGVPSINFLGKIGGPVF